MLTRAIFVGLCLLVGSVVAEDAVATVDTSKVTCGSTIKLMHSSTKSRLHSHDIS